MKKLFVLIVLVLTGALYLRAQTDKNKKPAPKPKPVPVVLGNEYKSGNIQFTAFSEAIKKGLQAKDSAGRQFVVSGFAFTYVERTLYEDSLGNPMIVPDYLMEYCFGDTLSTFLKNNIADRSKAGDTVYIDKITLVTPDGKSGAEGKSIKLVLTK